MASEETIESKTTTPVGQQLKQAREKKGLSDADIAQAQHLRPAIIQAIEAGDYQLVDSELFLKGYVRAYAKQVGLDDDALVAALDHELEPLRQQREQEVQANPLVDIERRRRRKRRIAKVVLLLAVAALAAYLVYVFVLPKPDSPSSSDAVESMSGVESSPQFPDTETSASDTFEPQPEPAPEPADLNAGNTTGAAAGQEQEVAGDQEPLIPQPATEPADASSEAVGSEPVDTNEPAVSASVEPALASTTVVEESEVADAPVVTAADPGRLQIRFEADCWVQVSDAAGNRLVNSLQRDGDQIDVSGQAPLRVVIGAVDAVASIQFGGEPVNMSEYRVVNNRTEFTLTN